jgi:hypothetical protein
VQGDAAWATWRSAVASRRKDSGETRGDFRDLIVGRGDEDEVYGVGE